LLDFGGKPLYSWLEFDQNDQLHVTFEQQERIYYGRCLDCETAK
jgi:hypothetical protein